MIRLSGESLSLPSALNKEWLLANGKGGFVSSTALGINTRRYHGFFIAPSGDRKLLLAKIEEEVIKGEERIPLSSNIYNDVVYPDGYKRIQSFLFNGWSAQWIYDVEGIILRKKVILPKGKDALVVLYKALRAETPFRLRLLPLLNFRSYHSLKKSSGEWVFRENGNLVEVIHPYRFFLICEKGMFKRGGDWYYDMTYIKEKERGLDYKEDHFNIGVFEVELKGGEEVGFICSTEAIEESAEELYERELRRAKGILGRSEIGRDDEIELLLLSADSFFVDWFGRKSIIAGYHWFTDWGRDAMIALPGLCLPLGRLDEGKEIIFSFLKHLKNGLIPNAFMERETIYNSVDATLWLFWAVYQLLRAKEDKTFAKEIFPYLLNIVDDLSKGKGENVRVEADGLLWAGNEGVCMNWMDAMVNGKPVVPRYGKAVEVNALWVFALSFLEMLCEKLGKDFPFSELLRSARDSFGEEFSAPVGLFDVIRGEEKVFALRPNQVIAGALPFVPITIEKKREIADLAMRELYIPFGLRSLGKSEKEYRGRYEGGVWERDTAYHQGTAWAYLTGFLWELLNDIGEKNLEWLIEPFYGHLREAGLGTISEIFDGDYPWTARGCISQAWSVGEVLRVLWEMRSKFSP
ncbi:MAG: amylo-alpha-1,6-glucosidase [bacterium]